MWGERLKSRILHQTAEQYEAEYMNASWVTAKKHNITKNPPYSRCPVIFMQIKQIQIYAPIPHCIEAVWSFSPTFNFLAGIS